MCDMLEDNCPDEDPFRPSATFLEPSCGTGNFLVEILSRKLARCADEADCLTALRSIYGIDILPDNVAESRERMLRIFVDRCGHEAEAMDILETNIICGNSLELMDAMQAAEELTPAEWFAKRRESA